MKNTAHDRNIILIGMPGSGKSTVGVILAKMMTRPYLDTDILIQLITGCSLQEIVDSKGHMALRKIEEDVLLDINCSNHIIATGGSAAYSEPAMVHLKKNGFFVFLDATLATLKSRITNYETRGLAKRPDQSFLDLFNERHELYNRYADIVIPCNERSQEEVAEMIIVADKH
ncbi:MAG: shikimate kinase [Desulfocapsaceae bacterium]|jgi:shikimate kinase|nr:shikimate kinase [Desulfocapsaceae bacterium]